MTKLTITLAQLKALHPCDLPARRALYANFKPGHALTARQALKAGASVQDILWVLSRAGRKDICVRFALYAAQHVAHISKRPWQTNACLEAVRAWLADPSEANRLACWRLASAYTAPAAAAAAAAADTYAAYAAYAYAAAAAAIYAAATHYAAYAYAAYTAADYAAAADVGERKYQRQLIIDLCNGKAPQQ